MICHSPIFWLGFFPVVVILWAWADSLNFQTQWFRRPEPKIATVVEVSRSALQFRKQHAVRRSEAEVGSAMTKLYENVPPYRDVGPLGSITRHPYISKRIIIPWFPAPAEIDEKQNSSVWRLTNTGFRIPFWLLLAGFLPLWLAGSWWDVRRRRARQRTA